MNGKDRKAAVSIIKREINRRRVNIPIDPSSVISGGVGISTSFCESIRLTRRIIKEVVKAEFFPNSTEPDEKEEADRLIARALYELLRDAFYSLEGELS